MIPYTPIPIIALAGFKIGVAPLMSMLGFVAFGFFASKILKKEKLDYDCNEHLLFIFLLAILSLAFGRMWHFAFDFNGLATIKDFFNIFVPGLTSYGMILGGIVFLFLWIIFRKNSTNILLDFGKYADPLGISAPIFLIIYRIGCYFNGCCYGIKTSMPWALYHTGHDVAVHPTQLYSIINGIIIFLLLNYFFRNPHFSGRIRKSFDGEIAWWFLLLYCTGRFIIDFFRYYPSGTLFFGLYLSQWICVSLIFISTAAIIYYSKKPVKIKKHAK